MSDQSHAFPLRVAATGSWDHLAPLQAALAEHGHLALVDLADADVVVHAVADEGLSRAELDALGAQRLPVVVLATAESSQLLEQALGAGADILLLPQPVESLVFALRKASRSSRRTAPVPTESHARIVTVFSPKGGTGKSVTATNMAAWLAHERGLRTLLVDLDLQFGDTAIMLGLEPDHTIHELVRSPGTLDGDKLSGFLTPHSSGVHVLAAPLRAEEAELVGDERVSQVLSVARAAYDVVVVDTSPFFHGPMLQALDVTDDLLLLSTPDVPTLKNIRLTLNTLELLAFASDRIRLVLNRSNSDVGLKRREVEEALELEVAYELPSDRGVPMSVNQGEALVLSKPANPFSRAIATLATGVLAGGPEGEQRSHGRRRLPWRRSAAGSTAGPRPVVLGGDG